MKNILISAIVALVVVVPGLVFFGQPSVTEVVKVIKELGAIPGNDLPSISKIGGAPLVGLSQTGSSGTTTPCIFDVRSYASSSIVSLGATIMGLPTTTSDTLWRWYKGVGLTSTTTALTDGMSVTATGTTVFATTSLFASNTATLGAGDNYIVLDYQRGTTPYLAMAGRTAQCSVLLHSPNTQ